MLFSKHEIVSTAWRFTLLRPYVLRPYVPAPLCPANFCLRPYVVDQHCTAYH